MSRGALDLNAAEQLQAESAIDCDMERPFSRDSLYAVLARPVAPNMGLRRPEDPNEGDPARLRTGDSMPLEVFARAGMADPVLWGVENGCCTITGCVLGGDLGVCSTRANRPDDDAMREANRTDTRSKHEKLARLASALEFYISKIVYKRQSSILHRKAKTSLQEP